MQLFFKRLLRIAKKILSDVHFRTQQEFEEYLKNHPGYRENTRFFVNGVQVKAPPKQKKKPSTSQRSTEELFKQYSEIRGYSLENVFNKLFENAESQGKDLKSFSDENKKIMLDFLNKQIKKSGYKKGLSEKEFQSIFDHLLSKRKKSKKKAKSMFGDIEKIENDLHGVYWLDKPRTDGESGGINVKYFLDHGDFRSIFKPFEYYNPQGFERFAYLVDKSIGLDIVPPTIERAVILGGKTMLGSLQMIVPNSKTIFETSNSKDFDPDFFTTPSDELDDYIFSMEKMAVLDFLIGNTDRHCGNFMINENRKIFAIDNGLGRALGKLHGPFRGAAFDTLYILNNKNISKDQLRQMASKGPADFVNMFKEYDDDDILRLFTIDYDLKPPSKKIVEIIKNIDEEKIRKQIDGVFSSPMDFSVFFEKIKLLKNAVDTLDKIV